jgi:nitroreductase
MNSIFHRTSIRRYTDAPVEKEKIEQMLRAAMAAPSAHNQQPWEFYVVTDPQKIEELSEASPYAKFAKAAPLIFAPCYRMDGPAPSYAQIDMSAAVENLLLEADALGLGATWIGIAPQEENMRRVRENLQIPEHLTPFALVACGYPAVEKNQQDRYDASRVHWIKSEEEAK